VFRTSTLSVDAGHERYVCYAVTTSTELRINRFSFSKTLAIHHFLFSEAGQPLSEGLSDCNVFQYTDSTLFTATTAGVDLATPAGSAKIVAPGTQLVLQAHLLNTTDAPIDTAIEIRMDASSDLNAVPVGILGFGSANIQLPPGQVTTVESICTLDQDTRFYAIVPHMHYLGKRVELAFGPDQSSLETVYVRDPYDFNDQHFDAFEQTMPAGTIARVRCIYDNDTDRTVRFGESSQDEMCNVPGFIVGRDGVTLCTHPLATTSVPRTPDSGLCGVTTTPSGIGAVCSAGKHTCAGDLLCSADYLNQPLGICSLIGCASNDDCDGAVCCTDASVAGVANFCVPEACRPDSCIPVGDQ
jgi:hypothetical protein